MRVLSFRSGDNYRAIHAMHPHAKGRTRVDHAQQVVEEALCLPRAEQNSQDCSYDVMSACSASEL